MKTIDADVLLESLDWCVKTWEDSSNKEADPLHKMLYTVTASAIKSVAMSVQESIKEQQ